MERKNVTFLTHAAMIAAIYVVLTVVFQPFSFGEVQVRLCRQSHRPDRRTGFLPEPLCRILLPQITACDKNDFVGFHTRFLRLLKIRVFHRENWLSFQQIFNLSTSFPVENLWKALSAQQITRWRQAVHHHSTKCQKVVQIHKLLFLTYAKSEKGVHGGSPLTLRPRRVAADLTPQFQL